jgi:hypothetical protein
LSLNYLTDVDYEDDDDVPFKFLLL